MKTEWAYCDGPSRDGSYCLYEQRSLRKMKGDPLRCIRHGNILERLGSKYDGMTREQVRAALDKPATTSVHQWR